MNFSLYHIAFVAKNLRLALEFYEKLGFSPSNVEEDPIDKFRYSCVSIQGVKIMVMEPTDPNGPVGRFLSRRGEGFHHIAFKVPDCRATHKELREKGIEFFGNEPREQSYEIGTFIKPGSTNGILVEIVQPK